MSESVEEVEGVDLKALRGSVEVNFEECDTKLLREVIELISLSSWLECEIITRD
ncbi:hypothetical protein PFJ87_11g02330 [Encephalitozoon hellem]|uniref:Uncharacterized protein n=1 Tax=Encephalitozoon hellem TaxID=27973 RepID=A0ABY8CM53_ENCHE|nr:hypothetical protein PFJ87_07g02240 [Encephalitozoon hellem]WEL39563.1 hypothetical protein PFJ87_10g00070 [Encephalitozoon hellem]WEL39994.1 hypothetical protein PFJ87_11g02330 [Encephalitozoon hellem]